MLSLANSLLARFKGEASDSLFEGGNMASVPMMGLLGEDVLGDEIDGPMDVARVCNSTLIIVAINGKRES